MNANPVRPDRIITTQTHIGPQPSKAWREANPGLPVSECPPNEREVVVSLVLVATYPQITQPDPSQWPQYAKVLRELHRAPEHEVLGDVPANAPSEIRLS